MSIPSPFRFRPSRPRPGVFAAALTALLALLAVLPALAQAQAPASPPPYRLQPGDEVAVSVIPQKEFDCAGVILPDGMLFLKNIGGIRAAGLTIAELTRLVEKALSEELNEPRITVALTKMAPPPAPRPEKPVRPGRVTIVGEVARTGPLDLEEGLRLRKALDLAGGTTKSADLANILIIHRDLTRSIVDLSTEERVLSPAHNRLLQDGDSVEVRALPFAPPRAAPMVRIRGQVLNPGQFELKPGMTLEDLILAAGKLLPLADVERVQLQRRGQPLRSVNLVEQARLGLAGKVLLEEGDEVFLTEHENRVLLIGAVQNPGPRSLRPGQKIREFLLSSGDAAVFNPALLNLEGAELIRGGDEKPLRVNLKAVLKQEDHRENLALRNGDVLFLPPRKGPRRGVLDYLYQISPLSFLFGLF